MADPLYTPSVKNRLRFDRPQGLSDEQAQIGRDNLKVEEVMQAALPCPTRIRSGRTYRVLEDQQVPFFVPIEIEEGGSLVIEDGGILYQV